TVRRPLARLSPGLCVAGRCLLRSDGPCARQPRHGQAGVAVGVRRGLRARRCCGRDASGKGFHTCWSRVGSRLPEAEPWRKRAARRFCLLHIPPESYINTCAAPSSMERENVCKVGEGVTLCHADARQALWVMDVCEARGL